jgi:uncharacterized protein YdhG (YjbR/CyaY superfamily)
METKRSKATNIDDYISEFPPDIQEILQAIRTTVREAAPGAAETINYAIPTFTMGGRNLVHFAAFPKHIGFYPTPGGIEQFKDELSKYHGAKGSVQFPLDQPMPYELIRRIVAFRVQQETERQAAKAKKPKRSA